MNVQKEKKRVMESTNLDTIGIVLLVLKAIYDIIKQRIKK